MAHLLAPITSENRHATIALNAYYLAQSCGFARGREVEDWLAAERQIDVVLVAGVLPELGPDPREA